MKFKTVSEFIHALEVEGKKFVHPYCPDLYFIEWREGCLQEIPIDPDGVSSGYGVSFSDLDHDWQEYQPETPETEEIELVEVLADCEDGSFRTYWVEKGRDIKSARFCNPIITGMTRKVKVPK